MSTSDPTKLARRLSKVKHILLVLSGKGGVGKSSISVQLALSLLNQGNNNDGGEDTDTSKQPVRIGLLDIDLTGPSIPRMLGLDGASIHQSNDGWVPVYLPIQHLQAGPSSSLHMSNQEEGQGDRQQPEASTSSIPAASSASLDEERPVAVENGNGTQVQHELKVMSIGFLLKDSRQAVVWRGPKKSAMIRQFLADVRWGELDWLIIDTPPGECATSALGFDRVIFVVLNTPYMYILAGTSDEHISLLENLLPALQSNPNTTLHSVLVTTPQAVSLSDVSKELSFTRRVGLPVLGLVENMSGYVCPHCGDITNIFGKGGGEEFCRLETEKAEEEDRRALQQQNGHSAAAVTNGTDSGNTSTMQTQEKKTSKLKFLGRVPVDPDFVKVVDGPESGKGLLERYNKTKSSAILSEICAKLVESVNEQQQEKPPADIAQATQSITLA